MYTKSPATQHNRATGIYEHSKAARAQKQQQLEEKALRRATQLGAVHNTFASSGTMSKAAAVGTVLAIGAAATVLSGLQTTQAAPVARPSGRGKFLTNCLTDYSKHTSYHASSSSSSGGVTKHTLHNSCAKPQQVFLHGRCRIGKPTDEGKIIDVAASSNKEVNTKAIPSCAEPFSPMRDNSSEKPKSPQKPAAKVSPEPKEVPMAEVKFKLSVESFFIRDVFIECTWDNPDGTKSTLHSGQSKSLYKEVYYGSNLNASIQVPKHAKNVKCSIGRQFYLNHNYYMTDFDMGDVSNGARINGDLYFSNSVTRSYLQCNTCIEQDD